MPVTQRTELSEQTAPGLLEGLGVIEPGVEVSVQSLSGGVANAVLAVSWRGGDVVAKQALPKLRVEADWPFDPERTNIERECLAYLAGVLPGGSVPEVVAFDPANDLLVISRAPRDGVVWKQALLAGDVDPAVGADVGRLLGELHRASSEDRAAAATFAAKWPLIQGRTDPYHRTVAAKHPDMREAILAEIQRLEATSSALVLGDFSPKNIIVYPHRGPLLLDFEVAHYGDPAFDVAFLLTHFALKARHRTSSAAAIRECATSFLRAYDDSAGEARPPGPAVVAELGCLLLSRVDGKSPAEYLDEAADGETLRSVARGLLLEPPATAQAAVDYAIDELAAPVGRP